jgi:hypothetical protein
VAIGHSPGRIRGQLPEKGAAIVNGGIQPLKCYRRESGAGVSSDIGKPDRQRVSLACAAPASHGQKRCESWAPVIARVAAELAAVIAGGASRSLQSI